MLLLAFYINFMGLIGCYSNHCCLDAKSLKANFVEANCLCKVACTTESKKTTMREAQAINGHSALIQFRLLYYLVAMYSTRNHSKTHINKPLNLLKTFHLKCQSIIQQQHAVVQ